MEKSLMTTPTGGVVSKFQIFNLDLPIDLRRVICRMPYMSWVFAEAPMATPLCRHEVYDKYTFGDKFISREAQGEFVFVDLKRSQWNWSPDSMFQIGCEDGDFFVKPGEGNMVIKNGVILNKTARPWLHFGDELGFMKYRNDISGGLAMFSFQERKYTTNWDKNGRNSAESGPENGAGLNFTPGKNQLIFSHILSHLSLGNLKNARLVCKQWDEQVSPLVRKKSIIRFSNYCTTPSMRFSWYSVGQMSTST
ncbi:hypothetical protein Fcan01_15940 [Folsomia candida]|uniref:F-box domain-containing protein n=1 Tax=Folsomia candida TaxID=158441 RepID=A0A226DX31_FOLCA|nr:hypothetical protein Fcan01_15940 [Folsomia candida]